MSKLETISDIRSFFENDPFAVNLGFIIEDGNPGSSRISVKLEKNHLNGANIPHGGLIFSLADFAGAVATNSYGFVSLSLDSSITYLAQATGNTLIATAHEVTRSKRITYIEIEVHDNNGTHIACAKGTYYITQKEIQMP